MDCRRAGGVLVDCSRYDLRPSISHARHGENIQGGGSYQMSVAEHVETINLKDIVITPEHAESRYTGHRLFVQLPSTIRSGLCMFHMSMSR